MIALQQRDDGVILPVRAQAGARMNALRGEQAGALKVAVTQVAEKGKANQAIVRMLSKALGIPRGDFELLSGATSSQKRFLVRAVDIDQLRDRIDTALGSNQS